MICVLWWVKHTSKNFQNTVKKLQQRPSCQCFCMSSSVICAVHADVTPRLWLVVECWMTLQGITLRPPGNHLPNTRKEERRLLGVRCDQTNVSFRLSNAAVDPIFPPPLTCFRYLSPSGIRYRHSFPLNIPPPRAMAVIRQFKTS